MQQQTNQLDNIVAVSSAVARLPLSAVCELSGGREIAIHRLTWLQFEALWSELAELLGALLAMRDDVPSEELAGRLAGAPAFVLKLSCLSSGLAEAELAGWAYDDVLALSAAALRLSFSDSAGLRDFFSALAAVAAPAAGSQAPIPPVAGQSAGRV